MDFLDKNFFGTLAVIITLVSFIPYFYYIFKKQVKAHAITFFIWTLTVGGIATSQWMEGAEQGAWTTTVVFFGVFLIFLLSCFYYGERNIVPFDWGCLAFALLGWSLWLFTNAPLYAVIILTLVDMTAIMPTYRKAYLEPEQESVIFYFLGTLNYVIGLGAFAVYNSINLIYPIMIILVNSTFMAMLIYRRKKMKI